MKPERRKATMKSRRLRWLVLLGLLVGAIGLVGCTGGNASVPSYLRAKAINSPIDKVELGASTMAGANIQEIGVPQFAEVGQIIVKDSPHPEITAKYQVKFNLAIVRVGQVYALPVPNDAYNKIPVLYVTAINGNRVEYQEINVTGVTVFDSGVPGDD
jgi:hypothetical protein